MKLLGSPVRRTLAISEHEELIMDNKSSESNASLHCDGSTVPHPVMKDFFGQPLIVPKPAIPMDFIAFKILWKTPRRYIQNGINDWHVLVWSDRWDFFDNVGDKTAANAYWDATMVFCAHARPLKP